MPTSQPRRLFTPAEGAILDRVAEGPASYGALVKIAESAGASASDARAAIRRLQSAGLIGHNLTTGYVLGCFLENN